MDGACLLKPCILVAVKGLRCLFAIGELRVTKIELLALQKLNIPEFRNSFRMVQDSRRLKQNVAT